LASKDVWSEYNFGYRYYNKSHSRFNWKRNSRDMDNQVIIFIKWCSTDQNMYIITLGGGILRNNF
jgi:hypothetical protein